MGRITPPPPPVHVCVMKNSVHGRDNEQIWPLLANTNHYDTTCACVGVQLGITGDLGSRCRFSVSSYLIGAIFFKFVLFFGSAYWATGNILSFGRRCMARFSIHMSGSLEILRCLKRFKHSTWSTRTRTSCSQGFGKQQKTTPQKDGSENPFADISKSIEYVNLVWDVNDTHDNALSLATVSVIDSLRYAHYDEK